MTKRPAATAAPLSLPGRAVCVHWLDAATLAGWNERRLVVAEIGAGMPVWSVGFVLADEAEGMLLTQGIGTDSKVVCASQFIPRAMIVNITELVVT